MMSGFSSSRQREAGAESCPRSKAMLRIHGFMRKNVESARPWVEKAR